MENGIKEKDWVKTKYQTPDARGYEYLTSNTA